jgi:hypothetical protein
MPPPLSPRFATVGNDLLRDPSTSQDLRSVLIASVERPGMITCVPILPESVRLDDPAAFELIGGELGQLGISFELAERLPGLSEFKQIVEREWFSRQIAYSGGKN